MIAEIAASIERFESLPFQQMIAATFAAYKPYHEAVPYHGITIDRDTYYGSDPRHRLDIFRAEPNATDLPVIVFVHGGGFVAGDKSNAGSPYNDHVPLWCARQGYVGVNMTYRLAPAAVFPAGGQDVALAIAWLRSNIAAFGGNPDRIVLFGQSAGATHAATYVARHGSARDIIGVVLLSGVYDFRIGEAPPPNELAYVGHEVPRPSLTAAAAQAGLPLLLGISEFDPPMFHRQAQAMIDAWMAEHRRLPHIVFFPRHNHISQIAQLNARDIDDTQLADVLNDFVTSLIRPL
jgi:triacylglycerol lipase